MAMTAPVAPGKLTCGVTLLFADASEKLLNTRKSRWPVPRLPPIVLKAAVLVGTERTPSSPNAAPRPARARILLVVGFMGGLTFRPARRAARGARRAPGRGHRRA